MFWKNLFRSDPVKERLSDLRAEIRQSADHEYRPEDGQRRRELASRVAELGEPAVGPLCEALNDPDDEMRKYAIYALTMAPNAEARVKALVAAASSPGLSYLAETREGVVELGEQSIDPLLRALESKSSQVRIEVRFALKDLGPIAVPRMLAAVESTSPGARAEIASALGQIADQRAIPLLIKLLADPDKWVRYNTARNLRYIKNPKVIEALVGALDRTEIGYSVLVNVGESLVELGWSPKIKEHEILFDILHLDPASSFRPNGIDALGRVTRHGKAAVKQLLMVLKEDESPKSDNPCIYAIEALLEIGADERLLPVLNNLVERAEREDGYNADLIEAASKAIVRIKERSFAGPRPKPSLGLDAPKSAMEEVVTKDDLYVGDIIRIWHELLNQWATGWLLVEELLEMRIVFWDYEANDHTTRHVSDSIPCWRDPGSKSRL
jgi:HEAT repeat protein